jgi:hypothetical protein
VFEPTISTHDSRISQDFSGLGGHLKSLKLFKTEHNLALKGWRWRFNLSLATTF